MDQIVKVSHSEMPCSAGFTRAVPESLMVFFEQRDIDAYQDKSFVNLRLRRLRRFNKLNTIQIHNEHVDAKVLVESEREKYVRAIDISQHFRSIRKGFGPKALLVIENNAVALKYQNYLEAPGHINTEIILSAADISETDDTDSAGRGSGVLHYSNTRSLSGVSAAEHNKNIINRFRHGVMPEMLIVVADMLESLDLPCNVVMYLACKVTTRALTRALVKNCQVRDYETQSPGDYRMVIDYANNALIEQQVVSTPGETVPPGTTCCPCHFRDIKNQISTLSTYYLRLYRAFNVNGNWIDLETCTLILANRNAREVFYSLLDQYARCLKLAMSVNDFVIHTPEAELEQYQNGLKWFRNLYTAVVLRHADRRDYLDATLDYNVHNRDLWSSKGLKNNRLNQHELPVNQVNDEHAMYYSLPASKTDMAAHVLQHLISEMKAGGSWQSGKFTKQYHRAAEDYKAGRITGTEYIDLLSGIRGRLDNQVNENVPEVLYNNPLACACYEQIKPVFETSGLQVSTTDQLATRTVLALIDIIQQSWKVRFWDDIDAQNRVMNMIDDYLFDEVIAKSEITLSSEQIDQIIQIVFGQARQHINQLLQSP